MVTTSAIFNAFHTNTPIVSPQSIYCSKLLLTVIIVSSNNSDPEFLDVYVIVIWIITYAICSTNLKKPFNLTSMFYQPPFCNQALRVLINKETYFSFFIWKYTTSWSVKNIIYNHFIIFINKHVSDIWSKGPALKCVGQFQINF